MEERHWLSCRCVGMQMAGRKRLSMTSGLVRLRNLRLSKELRLAISSSRGQEADSNFEIWDLSVWTVFWVLNFGIWVFSHSALPRFVTSHVSAQHLSCNSTGNSTGGSTGKNAESLGFTEVLTGSRLQKGTRGVWLRHTRHAEK